MQERWPHTRQALWFSLGALFWIALASLLALLWYAIQHLPLAGDL